MNIYSVFIFRNSKAFTIHLPFLKKGRKLNEISEFVAEFDEHFQISSEGLDMEGNTIQLDKCLFYQIIHCIKLFIYI